MKTLVLENSMVGWGNLVLINRDHKIKRIPRENELSAVVPDSFPEIQIHRSAKAMLVDLWNDIESQGRIIPVSGYRTYEEQKQLYETSLLDNGRTFTEKYVAPPDASEHQSGLAIDLGHWDGVNDPDYICPSFPDEGKCREFRRRAGDWGFILRYPEGASDITGVAYEPWHFRYVGYPHSYIIEEKGFVLEEYIHFIKNFDAKYPFIFESPAAHGHTKTIKIRYIPTTDESRTVVELADNGPSQISGNNVDGLIITTWLT